MTIQKQEIGMVLTAILISATLSGCQSGVTAIPPETDAVTIDMAPAQMPAADTVGTRVEVLRNGKPETYTVTAVNGETSSGIDSNGCSYTELDWGLCAQPRVGELSRQYRYPDHYQSQGESLADVDGYEILIPVQGHGWQ